MKCKNCGNILASNAVSCFLCGNTDLEPINNNNNNFNGVDNLNNNSIPNQTPSTPINNLNYMPTQPQVNDGNVLSNSNMEEAGKFVQPIVAPIRQQPSVNQQSNNLNIQSNNIPFNPITEQQTSINQLSSNANSQSNNIAVAPTTQQQINNINSMPQNNNVDSISQSINVNPITQQNIGATNQTTTNTTSTNDEELLRAFIGNNYEKITTKPFNFAGFFFTTFYLFYRKMFLYGIILFIINIAVLSVINNFSVSILFNVAVGLLINKVYLYYANKKINKIKLQNPEKDINELKEICLAKGGTSVGKIFLGLLAELGIILVVSIVMLIAGIGGIIGSLINLDKTLNDSNINISEGDKNNGTLVEDVVISGYSCFNSKCTISIAKSNNYVDYLFITKNFDLFKILDNYSDYIKVNIYYIQNGEEKSIVDYEVFLKSNNENISNVTTEEELRTKIGLYSIGTHTDSFTLSEIGMTGTGFKDETSYTYTNYTFVDSKNVEYEMKYIDSGSALNLIEGNKYSVTFEVVEDVFGYEFYIKSIN